MTNQNQKEGTRYFILSDNFGRQDSNTSCSVFMKAELIDSDVWHQDGGWE